MTQHGEGEHGPSGHGHDDHGHGGFAKYIYVFLGLCLLTTISFWLGNSTIKHEAPQVAWAGMMAVSCGKALLVMLFFMHLLWEANWKYVLTIPASIMSVFLLLMLIPDIGFRTEKYSVQRWLYAPPPEQSAEELEGEPQQPAHGADAGERDADE